MQRLYTPEEVAEQLRVTRRSVYEWLKSGRLRGLRAGTRWRIRPEDVESFLHGNRTIPGPEPAEERAARVRAAQGALAHVPLTADEFLEWKREEAKRENQPWGEGESAQTAVPSE
jgi:excisionase family DNA binding protein